MIPFVQYLFSFIVIALSSVTFLGCGDESEDNSVDVGDNENSDVKNEDSLSAKVDGKNWKADTTVATFKNNVLSVNFILHYFF